MTDDPFEEGVAARDAGVDWDGCPYPAETVEREEWEDGWYWAADDETEG